jgi:hypothetical protein
MPMKQPLTTCGKLAACQDCVTIALILIATWLGRCIVQLTSRGCDLLTW